MYNEILIEPSYKFRTNAKYLLPFVLILSNHDWNLPVQSFFKYTGLSAIFLALSACGWRGGIFTTVGPDYKSPQLTTTKLWSLPQGTQPYLVAHQGKLGALKHWWQSFNDPVLNHLLVAAQEESASIASAKAVIEQARANLVGADSILLPSVDLKAESSRASTPFGSAPVNITQHQIGLQSSWEIDLFGGVSRQREAALSQLQSKGAAWHDARVAVAAELADQYLAYRHCMVQLQQAQDEADSRHKSAQLLVISSNAGFTSPGDVALARASSADSKKLLLERQKQCQNAIKSLAVLTGIFEPKLLKLLTPSSSAKQSLPKPAAFVIHPVPAEVIRQRPDIIAAERDMAEACAKIGVEQANRFPRLSLSGNITPILQNINSTGFALAQTWAIGPTLSLPLFDGGKRAANVDAAQADYEAATANFRAKVRKAVKEVEEAMLRITSADQQLPQAKIAADAYQAKLQVSQKLYDVGLVSLIDVETARRNAITVDTAMIDLERERVSAWIALYRSVGGSWDQPVELSSDAGITESDKRLNSTKLGQP